MSPHDKRDSNLCNAQVMSPYEVNKILDIVSEDSDATEQWWNELEENIAKSFDGENINRIGARHKTLLDTDKDSSTGGHVDGPGKPHCSGYGGHVDGPGKPHCSGTGGQVDGPGKPHCSSCDQVERFWIGDEDIWARRETQQDSWKDKDEHDNQIYDHEPHHIALSCADTTKPSLQPLLSTTRLRRRITRCARAGAKTPPANRGQGT